MKTNMLTPELLDKRGAYWRTANYLSAGQIYLYDNPLQSPSTKASRPGREMKIMKTQINTDNHKFWS